MHDHDPVPPAAPIKPAAVPRLRSEDLFAGAREVVIEHDGHDYRLRLTSQNKLLLTK